MNLKHSLVTGTFSLTIAGLLTRFIGFFFRIFLSHTFGEEQVGLYQLIFPVYGFCCAITTAGIETALSKCVAQNSSSGEHRKSVLLFYQSLGISLSSAFLLSFLIRSNASLLSIYILGDLRCETLLETISFALPFSAIHCCVCGYFLGKKETTIPAVSQFIEQLIRVSTVFIIYQISINNHTHTTIRIAVLGLLLGECGSSLFCLRHYFKRNAIRITSLPFRSGLSCLRELMSLAIPLTASRIFMTLLQSMEAISIPLHLQKYGLSSSESLGIYGVLTGMALPCILFPTAITNSLSIMLIPTVAELQSHKSSNTLAKLLKKVLLFDFSLGFCFCFLFLICGRFLGQLLFASPLAGNFLQTLAWICPFLYTNASLLSILNGLGKVNSAFVINLCGLLVRISSVWFGIPFAGMTGYLLGLLISQLTVSFLSILELKKNMTFI